MEDSSDRSCDEDAHESPEDEEPEALEGEFLTLEHIIALQILEEISPHIRMDGLDDPDEVSAEMERLRAIANERAENEDQSLLIAVHMSNEYHRRMVEFHRATAEDPSTIIRRLNDRLDRMKEAREENPFLIALRESQEDKS